MGNQQAKISEIWWLAGFMDGEGWFGFFTNHVKYRGKPYTFYYPGIAVCNTHKPTLEDVVFILDALEVGHNVEWRTPSNPKNKRSWAVGIKGMKRVDKLLFAISPFLRTKREQAKRMKAWIQLRQQHEPGNQHRKYDPYSEQELQLMREVKEMNH